MTSWHRVGQSIASGPQCFFFVPWNQKICDWKEFNFRWKIHVFGAHWSGFSWFMLVRRYPQSFRHQFVKRFTHTHTHISHIDRNFQIPVAGIWSQGAALSVNGDLVIQFISFQSLSDVSRRNAQNWRMFCATPMVDGKKSQHFFGTLDTSWAVLPLDTHNRVHESWGAMAILLTDRDAIDGKSYSRRSVTLPRKGINLPLSPWNGMAHSEKVSL